jgi:SAM-dependent methyltransferase
VNKKIIFQTFNEEFYLEKNPDVLAAVKMGNFKSGWHHYLEFGWREKRRGIIKIKDSLLPITKDDKLPPSPPDDLIERVGGVREQNNYYHVGKNIAHILHNTTKTEAIPLNPEAKILDFGCGCGRVITWLQQLNSKYQYFGTDIDPEAITWCQENLANFGEYAVNPHLPPTEYADNYFDLVYSISVFTHLSEDMQFTWLKELSRITKPGGYLLLTTHNDDLFPFSSGIEHDKLEQTGFYFLIGKNTPGLPDFYQTTFHSRSYVYHVWSQYFTIQNIISRGILNHQDIIVCQK